jgi:spore maturation protein SpmB
MIHDHLGGAAGGHGIATFRERNGRVFSHNSTGTGGEQVRFFQIFRRGLYSGFKTTGILALVIVPIYLVITLLNQTPVLHWIGRLCRPLMEFMGLPGEAVMGVVLGNFINLYAAIGAVTPLRLDHRQMTIFALLLLVSHSLPLEAAVSRMAGVRAWPFILMRIGCGILLAAGLNLCWPV